MNPPVISAAPCVVKYWLPNGGQVACLLLSDHKRLRLVSLGYGEALTAPLSDAHHMRAVTLPSGAAYPASRAAKALRKHMRGRGGLGKRALVLLRSHGL